MHKEFLNVWPPKGKKVTNLCVAPSFCFSYCWRCLSMSASNIFSSSSQRSPEVRFVIPHNCNCWLKSWHALKSEPDIWPEYLWSKSHRNTVNFCSFWKQNIHYFKLEEEGKVKKANENLLYEYIATPYLWGVRIFGTNVPQLSHGFFLWDKSSIQGHSILYCW